MEVSSAKAMQTRYGLVPRDNLNRRLLLRCNYTLGKSTAVRPLKVGVSLLERMTVVGGRSQRKQGLERTIKSSLPGLKLVFLKT